MSMKIRIERLILDGFPLARGQEHLVQSVVEAELARLLTAGGLADGLLGEGKYRNRAGRSVKSGSEANPGSLGRQIALAVQKGNRG